MAVFDRDSARIVVRLVYDGPGNAGKTTNLVEMCQFFTSRRRSELVSPEERDGRTMWFDWLQIDGGLVAGYGLRCQIVTVPGQLVLRRRRSVLLRAADVVVLVCDSTPAGLELVRPAFGRIRQFVAEHTGCEVPIVLQANKQDLPGAIAPDDIAAALGADTAIPVIGARANVGIGVKETLVLAIRAAANRAQELVLERGIDGLTGVPDDADAVLAELRQLRDTHEGALAPLLAHDTFVDAGHGSRPIRVPLIPPPPPIVSGSPVAASVTPLESGWVMESVPDPVTESVSDPVVESVSIPTPPASRPVVESAAESATESLLIERPAWWPLPPLRDALVAPGSLWPAATGREALRRLAGIEPSPRLDLVAQRGDRDGSGKASTVIYDGDGWCLKTSRQRRFDDLDAARVALVKLARIKISLGTLTLGSTVLVIGGDARGFWVWTFAPWRPTLRAAMTQAVAAADAAALAETLGRFAGAVTESLVRAVRTGQGLDLHPSNFAIDEDRLVYLDDDVTSAPPVPGTAHAILQRAEELAAYPAAIEHYAGALIEDMSTRLGADELARLGVLEDLVRSAPRSLVARALRDRLLVAFGATLPADLPVNEPARTRVATGSWSAPGTSQALVAEPPSALVAEPSTLVAEPSTRVVEPSTRVAEAPPVRAAEPWPVPPTSAESLPSGFIWPVVAGRELIRQLASRTPTPRAGLPFTYDLGDYTLSTSSQRRFSEVDDGRAELLRLARALVARGPLTDVAVLMLAPDSARGGHWIWTIAPAASDTLASP
jgi:signal recognition particle receptor subunit beta